MEHLSTYVSYAFAFATQKPNRGILSYQLDVYRTKNRKLIDRMVALYLESILIAHLEIEPESFSQADWAKAINLYERKLFVVANQSVSAYRA